MRTPTLLSAAAFSATVLLVSTLGAPTYADDLVGVASCDSFLNTYTTCVAAKLPADQRAAVTETIAQTKANWKTVAGSGAEGKAKLDTTCKETAEKMKKEVAALNCAW